MITEALVVEEMHAQTGVIPVSCRISRHRADSLTNKAIWMVVFHKTVRFFRLFNNPERSPGTSRKLRRSLCITQDARSTVPQPDAPDHRSVGTVLLASVIMKSPQMLIARCCPGAPTATSLTQLAMPAVLLL